MNRRQFTLAGLAAIATIATACGDDDTTVSGSSTTSGVGTGGSGIPTAGEKIVLSPIERAGL